MITDRRLPFFILLGIILLAAYGHTLPFDFVFDDKASITHNKFLRLTDPSIFELIKASFHACFTRPVANFTFALNYQIGHFNPAGYRFVNLIIHLINGILVFFLLDKTWRLSGHNEKSLVPFWGALIWFVNPIQIQAVTYIVQRMTSLATMFYLSSLLAYIEGRTTQDRIRKYIAYSACFLCGLLSLGSKEIACTLPIIIWLYDIYFLKSRSRSDILKTAGLFFIFILICIFFVYITSGNPLKFLNGYNHRNFTLTERLLTEPRVILFYFSLFFFPYYKRFNLCHDFTLSHSLLDPPQTLIAIGLLIISLLTAWKLKKNNPILSFSIFWCFINLALESSIIPLEIIFEHRFYLPSVFLGLIFVMASEYLIKNKTYLSLFMASLVLILCYFTYERNRVWESSLSLWQDIVDKSPSDSRANEHLGHEFFLRNKYKEAEFYSKKAVELDPHNVSARNNLAVTLRETGRKAQAITLLKDNLVIDNKFIASYYNLAKIYQESGELTEAIATYQKLLSVEPDFAHAYLNLAKIHFKLHHQETAYENINLALKYAFNDPDIHKQAGDILLINHDYEKAKEAYLHSLELNAHQPEIYNTLGGIYFKQNNFKKAQTCFLEAVKLAPDFAGAKRNLAIVTIRLKKDNSTR